MDILGTIISNKRKDLENRKQGFPVYQLEKSQFFKKNMPSFFDSLSSAAPSVIGEFKRKSPSAGIINQNAEPGAVALAYEGAGISAMSILTDPDFFGGSDRDLRMVASISKLPLLRKDFIIDEYQVIESKSIGAAAILLIASVLSKEEVMKFSSLAFNLGMEVLFEIHDISEIDKLNEKIRIIGVNNRDLKTFNVSIEHSVSLLARLPAQCIKVAESGIQSAMDIKVLYDAGFNAFLVGERFMNSRDPGRTAYNFMNELRVLTV
jgi:indole-3-glycerol phosphate synthase